MILSQQNVANWLMADAADGLCRRSSKAGRRTGKPLKSAVVITDGEWHRVGLTSDGTTRILYVDDIEAAKDYTARPDWLDPGLYIGAGCTLAPGTFWSGLIDDVRISNRAIKP